MLTILVSHLQYASHDFLSTFRYHERSGRIDDRGVIMDIRSRSSMNKPGVEVVHRVAEAETAT